jgi:branched-subunit amino acid transport protein
VPVAALTALTLPALLFPEGSVDISSANPRFYAGLLAFIVAYRTRSVLWTLVVGMVAFWILSAVI